MANAARKIRFEDQKRGDADRIKIADIVRRYASIEQQRNRLIQWILRRGGFEFGIDRFEQAEFAADHAAGDINSFEEFPELNELPSLIMLERLIGEPLKEHRADHHRAVNIFGGFIESCRRIVAVSSIAC